MRNKTYEEYYAIWKEALEKMNGQKTFDGKRIINRTPEEIEHTARDMANEGVIEDKIEEILEKICKENGLRYAQYQLGTIAYLIVGKSKRPGYEKNFQDKIDRYYKKIGLDKFIDSIDLSDVNIEYINERKSRPRKNRPINQEIDDDILLATIGKP